MNAAARQLPEWTNSYALLRDRIPSVPSPEEVRSVSEDGNDVELLRYWPQGSWKAPSDATRLMLLGARNDQAATELSQQGWQHTATLVLLAGKPEDVEQVVKLPDTSTIFEAPMDNYDVVEVTDFDRPVARGRMHLGANFALLSDPDLYSPSQPDLARRAVLANFAGSAFQHGMSWMLLVAEEQHANPLAPGWSKATQISVMSRESN